MISPLAMSVPQVNMRVFSYLQKQLDGEGGGGFDGGAAGGAGGNLSGTSGTSSVADAAAFMSFSYTSGGDGSVSVTQTS